MLDARERAIKITQAERRFKISIVLVVLLIFAFVMLCTIILPVAFLLVAPALLAPLGFYMSRRSRTIESMRRECLAEGHCPGCGCNALTYSPVTGYRCGDCGGTFTSSGRVATLISRAGV
jgi:hypothetical protein